LCNVERCNETSNDQNKGKMLNHADDTHQNSIVDNWTTNKIEFDKQLTIAVKLCFEKDNGVEDDKAECEYLFVK
jgi:hypothetical protein